MTAVASAINSRPSVQWCITVTVHVCLRYRNPRTSEYAEKKRREHNLIYAAVNLKRECLIIDYRSRRIVLLKLKLTTDRHEASRGLFATAELHGDLKLKDEKGDTVICSSAKAKADSLCKFF